MRVSVMLAALAAVSACGGPSPKDRPFDPRPLDGFFAVSRSTVSDTCNRVDPDPDAPALIQFFLRDDGLYDVSHDSAGLPGPKRIDGMERDGGLVDYAAAGYALTGSATPDGLDIDLEYRSSYPHCDTEIRLEGPMWPVTDLTEAGGHYSIARTTLGNTCDGANRQTGTPRNTLLTITDDHGSLTILSSENWIIDDVVPDADGNVDWHGPLHTTLGGWHNATAAKLRGRFAPDDVQLVLSFWEYGTSPDTTLCADEESLVGAKRIPSLDGVDNDYRGSYVASEGCQTYGVSDGTTRGQARLITQPDGTVELIDPFLDLIVTIDDGTVHGRDGSPPEGHMVTVDGTLAPPLLSYTVTIDRFVQGLWQCAKTVTLTDAHVRYVFEQ